MGVVGRQRVERHGLVWWRVIRRLARGVRGVVADIAGQNAVLVKRKPQAFRMRNQLNVPDPLEAAAETEAGAEAKLC